MTMLLLIFSWQLKSISQHEVLDPSSHLLRLLISVQSHLALVFDIQVCAPYSLIFLLIVVWCMKICTELVCQTKDTEVFLFQSIKVKSPNKYQTSTIQTRPVKSSCYGLAFLFTPHTLLSCNATLRVSRLS